MRHFNVLTLTAVLAAVVVLPVAAYGQGLHGGTIAKGCVAPLCEGETTSCDIQFGHNDDWGDTIKVLEAWDVQDFGGDNVRVPATGNLPIVNVGGNTTCTIGGALPCLIGPGGSTLSGLPGDPNPGFVRFRQDAYVVQPDDPDVLRDQAMVAWEDLCDDPDTQGCGAGVINLAPAPASTSVTDCDDDDPCTIDICEAGQCTYLPVECDDVDLCTEDACDPATGECVFNPVVFCDDGDECTDDVCHPMTGECVVLPGFDGDGIIDACDNCPFFWNPNQDGNSDEDLLCDEEDPCKFFTNTLPLVISNAYGIPDECLCGDFDGDGFHSATDAAAINDCAAFIRLDCVPERDEVTEPFDGFYSATDADLVNRVAAFLDPAYTLTCPRRPEGTCGGDTGVSCF